MPKFRYRIALYLEHEEDNPDMPTLNVNTLALALAMYTARDLWPGLTVTVEDAWRVGDV